MTQRRKKSNTVLAVAVVVVALGLVGWGAVSSGVFSSGTAQVVEGAEVKRGPLEIAVIERGNLKAADSVSLKSEVEGNATILTLIKEGEHVAAGDLLCELDATSLVDKRVQQEITGRNAEAAYIKSKQNYEIQVSQNESDIAEAAQALTFAGQDLTKYEEGDKKLQLQKSEQAITLAQQEFKRAEDKLEWSKKLAEKGYLQTTELQADELEKSSTEIKLDQAQREDALLKEFQIQRDTDTLVAALDEGKRELARVKLQAKAKLVDFEADMITKEAQWNLEKEKLAKIERQINKAKIFAPKAGMVVYAKQEEGGRFGNSQPIAEGTSVRERQEIITIPNTNGMIAEASLHESVLNQVGVGMPVLVKVESLPGRDFHGTVTSVALLPDQNSWWANPNLRLYKSAIRIEDPVEEMRPGMSCSIEIQIETIADALFVPVQCVYRHKGRSVCFVLEPAGYRIAEVQPGKYNDKWVQIVSGLTEGERVMLSAPADFTPDPDEAESQQGAGAPTEGGARPGGATQMGNRPGPTSDAAGAPAGAPNAAPGGAGFERPDGAPSGGERRGQRGNRGGRPHGENGGGAKDSAGETAKDGAGSKAGDGAPGGGSGQ